MNIVRTPDESYLTARGSLKTAFPDHPFAVSFYNGLEESRIKENALITHLRSKGVKGIHPNDGWNDREKNILNPCYPGFWDNPKLYDIIAIGSHYKTYFLARIVKLGESCSGTLDYYHYEKLKEDAEDYLF